MNKIHILLALCMLLFTACSSDDILVGNTDGDTPEAQPIRLAVNNGVEAFSVDGSRSTAVDLQESTIKSGTEIGVFILTEDDYKNQTTPEKGSYGYENLRMRIGKDGSLENISGVEPIYPRGENLKAGIIAYAPYNKDMSWSDLKLHPCAVATDQSSDDAFIASDILVGRVAPTRTDDSITINFSHALSKITAYFAVNVDNKEMFRCDTLFITIKNAPVSSRISLFDNSFKTPVRKDIRMAFVKNASPIETNRFSASAIVMPHLSPQTKDRISFELKFHKPIFGTHDMIFTTTPIKQPFSRGSNVIFEAEINNSSNYETVDSY